MKILQKLSPKQISVGIVTILFLIVYFSNEVEEKKAFVLLYIGMIMCVLIYFKKKEMDATIMDHKSYYYKNEFLGKTILYNDRSFRIEKFIAIGSDCLENKFECTCLESGTKEYWYENELMQACAREDIRWLN